MTTRMTVHTTRHTTRHTSRSLLVLALFLAIAPTAAPGASAMKDRAQGHLGTPEQQRACRSDVVRHCQGIQGDYAIADCLKANSSRLRPVCRQALEKGAR